MRWIPYAFPFAARTARLIHNGDSCRMSEENSDNHFWTKRKALWVVAAHLAVMPFAFYALRSLDTENNVETWLPADDPHALVLNWFREEFGLDHGLLATWDGSTLNDPRVEAFATALSGPRDEEGERHEPIEGIHRVRTPHDLIHRMVEQKVDREEAVRRSQGLLIGTGPLKVLLTDSGRANQTAVVERIRRLADEQLGIDVQQLPAAVDEYALDEDDGQVDEEVEADEFTGPSAVDPYPAPSLHDFQLRWKEMVPQSEAAREIRQICESLTSPAGEPLVERAFYEAGSPVALVVTLTAYGEEHVDEMVALIRRTAEEVGIPEPTLHMGGAPVGRSELNKATQTATRNPRYSAWNLPMHSPLLTSALVGLGTALAVLRSVRLAVLVIVTSLYVAVMTTSLIPASGRNLNMVLLVMPNLLIVLTTSGAIHVANYWRHVAAEKMDGAIDSAVRIAWQPCTLASVTTAVGLTSLTTSVLSPVREFGAYSALGCLLSLLVVLLGFPALLRLWKGKAPTAAVADRSSWRAFGHWLYRHGTWVSLACLALFVGSTAGLRYFQTETKVIKYFPDHTRIIADYRFLEENLAGVVPVDVVISFDEQARENLDAVQRLELIREIKAEIADHPEISGTLALSDFRPPLETPPENAPRFAKIKYYRTENDLAEYLSNPANTSEGGLTAVATQPLKLEYANREVDVPAGAELWRVRAQVAVLSDLNYNDLTDDLEVMVDRALSPHAGTTHVVTGMVPLFLRTQQAVLESLIRSFALAFGVIALVMMFLLRSPIAGFITMLPNLLPVGVVFGLISWAGIPVDIGTMITASVALGIAIDGTLHLLTWFRDGLRNGMSREDAIALGLAHCGPAMWQTSAAIGLGLLMLATTELLLISRFGWLMAALIAAALVADIVFLPALLSGPLGTIIERNVVPKETDSDAVESTIQKPVEAGVGSTS